MGSVIKPIAPIGRINGQTLFGLRTRQLIARRLIVGCKWDQRGHHAHDRRGMDLHVCRFQRNVFGMIYNKRLVLLIGIHVFNHTCVRGQQGGVIFQFGPTTVERIQKVSGLQGRRLAQFQPSHHEITPCPKLLDLLIRNHGKGAFGFQPDKGAKRTPCIHIEIDRSVTNRKRNARRIRETS